MTLDLISLAKNVYREPLSVVIYSCREEMSCPEAAYVERLPPWKIRGTLPPPPLNKLGAQEEKTGTL